MKLFSRKKRLTPEQAEQIARQARHDEHDDRTEEVVRAALKAEAERLVPDSKPFVPVPVGDPWHEDGCDPVQPCAVKYDEDDKRADRPATWRICARHDTPRGRHHRQIATVTDVASKRGAVFSDQGGA